MAKIKPFRAVRACKDNVALVSSKNQNLSVNKKVKLNYNPFTFLHTISKISKKDISIDKKLKSIRKNYLNFKESKNLIQDDKPCFYIYKKVTKTNEYCGIIAGISVDDYNNNIIKKHEDTIEKREVLFKDYLQEIGFNSDPVLVTYPDNNLVNSILEKYEKEEPEYNFSSKNNTKHILWLIKDDEDIKQIQLAFKNIETLYIADGHHRCASSALLAKNKDKDSYNFILSYLISENNLKISEFNRFVKDLNGLSKNEFLNKLEYFFTIKNFGKEYYYPTEKNNFSMYLDGEFYSLTLKKDKYNFNNSLSKLDTEVLNRTILEPILGIKNIRNNSRIAYYSNKKDKLSIKNKVDKGYYKVSFGMLPININEIKQIADEGLKMLPKSTYIQPKLRSALTIYEY